MKSPTPQDLIKVVLECKGDVNQSNTDGTTPLFMASEFADIETVRKLKGREGSGLLDHLVNIPVSAKNYHHHHQQQHHQQQQQQQQQHALPLNI